MKAGVATLLIAILVVLSSTSAAPSSASEEAHHVTLLKRTFLADSKCYGAPIPPWKKGCKPGWNVGKPCKGLSLPRWDGGDLALCSWLSQIPFLSQYTTPFCQGKRPTSPIPPTCTPPTSGTTQPSCAGPNKEFQVVFTNYTTNATTGVYTGQIVGAATQDPSYLTYGMVDTLSDCFTMCNTVQNCTFINTYHDVEDDEPYGQHDPSKLKCVLFGACVDPLISNDNWGGQNDPNYITDSNGYCRSGKCPVKSS